MSPEKLSERIQYAKDTGMKRFDFWGVEWWFQLKKSRQTPEIWNTAKQEIQKINQQ